MKLTISDRQTRRTVEFFNEFSISLRYDSVGAVFSFLFYYNQENEDHRYLAQPGKFQVVRVEENGELLLTGLILQNSFTSKSQKQLLQISGYSVPGVLEDSHIPLSTYPLQHDGLNLKQITEKLLKPFQIKLEIDPLVESEVNKVYEKTEAGETQTVADYICELAKQRDIVVSHTPTGKLLFTKINDNKKPILNFGKDLIGTDYSLTFNGQALSQPIIAVKQADKDGGNAGQSELNNPYVPAVTQHFRPKTFVQTSGDDNDTQKVAKNTLKSQIKSAIVLKISIDRWVIDNKIIKPGEYIEIENKELYLFKRKRFFIEQVDLVKNNTATTANLTCVLPEVYNQEAPNLNIFYD